VWWAFRLESINTLCFYLYTQIFRLLLALAVSRVVKHANSVVMRRLISHSIANLVVSLMVSLVGPIEFFSLERDRVFLLRIQIIEGNFICVKS